MGAVTNIVLYAGALHGDGKENPKRGTRIALVADFSADYRRALVSIAPDDLFGVAKITSAAMKEYARNDAAGSPHAPLAVVRETRDADEQGKLTRADYEPCDPVSLRPIGEVVHSLDDAFAAFAAERK